MSQTSLHALDTEEDYEQQKDEEIEKFVHQKERERKEKWLKIPREQRVAIRRLHQMMGHCSVQSLVRMLKSSMAEKSVIDAAQHFRCQSCEEMKSDERPRTVRPTNPVHQIKFNDEMAANVFEVVDVKGDRHGILSMVDMATHYHVAVRVSPGGTPPSICAEAINSSWLSWAGAPHVFVSDQGVHNRGRVAALLQAHGTELRRTGARAPHQLGTAERHGGTIKEMMKRAIHDRQLCGAANIAALCSECARAKIVLINHGGYSPAQWVSGHTPEDLTSLNSQDPENHLGVHQGLVDAEERTPQEQFMMQLLMRQTAKEMYMQVDSSQRIRKALLRKSVPMRGPYHTGDLVCFSKNGKWFGPARVLTNEEKSSLWLVHGVTVLVAETSCRPASTQEIMKKHLLELRPVRKRKRELYAEHPEDEIYVPFADDGDEARSLRQRTEQQAPFIDVQEEVQAPPMSMPMSSAPMEQQTEDPQPASIPSGVAASPEGMDQLQSTDSLLDELQESTMMEEYTPSVAPPPRLEVQPEHQSVSATMSESSQPEFEPRVTPEVEDTTQGEETVTPLTQALRRSPDRLSCL